jgi:hypothetical protein
METWNRHLYIQDIEIKRVTKIIFQKIAPTFQSNISWFVLDVGINRDRSISISIAMGN